MVPKLSSHISSGKFNTRPHVLECNEPSNVFSVKIFGRASLWRFCLLIREALEFGEGISDIVEVCTICIMPATKFPFILFSGIEVLGGHRGLRLLAHDYIQFGQGICFLAAGEDDRG